MLSKKFFENMEKLFKTLCWDYWICPFCGSTEVAETWEIVEGRFRDGRPYGPYGGVDEYSLWQCDDCLANWSNYENIEIPYWRDWTYKGKMIKLDRKHT